MWLEYEFVLLKIEQSYVWERERGKKKDCISILNVHAASVNLNRVCRQELMKTTKNIFLGMSWIKFFSQKQK